MRKKHLHQEDYVHEEKTELGCMDSKYAVANWRVCRWRLDGSLVYVYPSHALHTTYHIKTMRKVLHAEVIEER